MKKHINKVVKFKEKIEEYEAELDEGMVGRIINVEERDDMYKIWFDTSDYQEHNKSCMKSNYYDKLGQPNLTAIESGFWPENGRHSCYFELDFNPEDYFEFVQNPDEYKVDKIILDKKELMRELTYAQKELDALYAFAIRNGIFEADIPPHVRLKEYIEKIEKT